jgi:hypothetical protein
MSSLVIIYFNLLSNHEPSRQANDGSENAPDEHPDGFGSRRSGKEPENVQAERVRGVNVNDDEHDAPNEQSQETNYFINSATL